MQRKNNMLAMKPTLEEYLQQMGWTLSSEYANSRRWFVWLLDDYRITVYCPWGIEDGTDFHLSIFSREDGEYTWAPWAYYSADEDFSFFHRTYTEGQLTQHYKTCDDWEAAVKQWIRGLSDDNTE